MTANAIVKNRYDFVMYFDCTNGNPNGDPQADNMPRVDIDTNIGLVTDVCIKRKIRNYIAMKHKDDIGFDIYVNRVSTLNDKDKEALKEADKQNIEAADKSKFVLNFMCSKYYDVRTFGAVMTEYKKKESKVDGSISQLTGPVQLNFARSVDPIDPQSVTISRIAAANEARAENDNELGHKWIIPYGLYRMEGYISANLAERTGFSEADLDELWDAIMNMFETDHTATRGNMALRKLIIFKHGSKMGNAPAYKLFDMVKAQRKPQAIIPRSYADYEITIPKNSDLPKGVEVIVKD